MLDRRRLLAAAAAALPLSACAAGVRFPLPGRERDELAGLDATATAELIRRREITAAEAVEAAIRRAETLNPTLGFLVAADFDRARALASAGTSGPFAGVPTLVKDLSDVQGLPTRRGSRFTDGIPPARATDPTNAALLSSGLISLGKSATPEYGFLPTTEPLAFPATRNPWDLSRSSGGSSGGAAAAVASGVVPLAHASDGGGSIRIPAALCGLFGLKPSRGRIVGDPVGATDLSVELCVSRSVRDSAALFAVMERRDTEAPLPPVGLVDGPANKRLRIGVFQAAPDGGLRDPDVARSIDVATALVRGLGHAVEPVEWPFRVEELSDAFWNAWASGAAELAAFAARRLGRAPTEAELEPFTLGLAERYGRLPAGAMDRSRAALGRAAGAYLEMFQQYDVLVSPVTATAAPPLGYFRPDQPFDAMVERLTRFSIYTPLHNVAGSPAMSVPLHWTAGGLPLGVQFAADVGRERTLFELAYQLEAEKPWSGKRPAVFA